MYPFAAVQQPAQLYQVRVQLDTAGTFERIAGTDLVGDRTDDADPRGQVGRLGVRAAAQERFENLGGS